MKGTILLNFLYFYKFSKMANENITLIIIKRICVFKENTFLKENIPYISRNLQKIVCVNRDKHFCLSRLVSSQQQK